MGYDFSGCAASTKPIIAKESMIFSPNVIAKLRLFDSMLFAMIIN